MNIFLHRDDLRIHDNRGLETASSSGKTVPVYIDDPRIREKTGTNKRAFRQEGLKELRHKYENRDSGLIVRKGKTGDELEKIIDERDIEEVFFARSYTPRKRKIGNEIKALDIETKSVNDRLLVEPQDLKKEYDTFSPFYREWKKVQRKPPADKPQNLASIESEMPEMNAEPPADIPDAGEDAALNRWVKFRRKNLGSYKDRRDDVANPEYVSKLSMYYSSGMIGKRKVLRDVVEMIDEEDDSDKIRNYAKYRNEIAWGEFFYQVMYHNPEAVQRNYKEIPNEINWKNDSEEFEAWKEGQTGIPFVDAGMRQLRNEGYMHNRLRQNVASFLTKHLMTDWRKGAKVFRKHLVDHNVPSNNGGWQWSASTGTDSIPIRIFNPVKQGRDYDEDAEYIKRHIPELRSLDAEQIHNWVEMGQKKRNSLDTEYPDPIINFNNRYHQGRQMFENALGK